MLVLLVHASLVVASLEDVLDDVWVEGVEDVPKKLSWRTSTRGGPRHVLGHVKELEQHLLVDDGHGQLIVVGHVDLLDLVDPEGLMSTDIPTSTQPRSPSGTARGTNSQVADGTGLHVQVTYGDSSTGRRTPSCHGSCRTTCHDQHELFALLFNIIIMSSTGLISNDPTDNDEGAIEFRDDRDGDREEEAKVGGERHWNHPFSQWWKGLLDIKKDANILLEVWRHYNEPIRQ